MLVMILLPFSLRGQVSENFDDGNLSTNPTWYGTTNRFIVNTQHQLQLFDSIAGMAWISTDDLVTGANEWRFWIQLKFAPSSGNYVRVYLQSDRKDLNLPLQGYFLQLGEKGSADALELFRQDSEQTISICRGQDSLIASSFAINIKVIRDGLGHWKILADPTGGDYFQPQAKGFDNTYTQGEFFGVECLYTKSNAQKVYLDNVYSGPVIRDTVAPEILSVQVKNLHSLEVLFDEVVDGPSAENTANYTLLPDGNHPDKAIVQPDGRTILLDFYESLQNKTHYTLKADSITDLAGNVMVTVQTPFDFYLPVKYDVVINEIMADPTPTQGLPDAEYLELYNTTDFTVDLTEWELVIGTRSRTFNPVSITAKGYLILCAEKNNSMFSSYGSVFGFPSLSLLNAGQNVELRDEHGSMMSRVIYQDNWYGDAIKNKGGWSLEQRNPENSCSGAENWTSSVNSSGGTPGTLNSVFDTLTDYPKPEYLQVIDNRNIAVFFNQRMDQSSLQNRNWWSTDIAPDTVFVSDDSLQKASLFYAQSFEKQRRYQLLISKQIKNCRGIPMKSDTLLNFGIPEVVDHNDVLFNEILFHPKTGGAEYVELANHSEKIVDLGKLSLGIVKQHSDGSRDTAYYRVSSRQILAFPGEYYLLTKDPEKVKEHYVTQNPQNFFRMESFPVLKNESGTVILMNTDHKMIDDFTYNEKMHYALLKRTDGISLERYDLDRDSHDTENWHSASEESGFGTPADQNSQFFNQHQMETVFHLEPAIFSPDGDGYNDVLKIDYRLNKPGYSVQINIFNASGALMRQLYNNEYLGTSGSLRWNGKLENNTTAPPGIYILHIRLQNLDGTIHQFKKTVVVARK